MIYRMFYAGKVRQEGGNNRMIFLKKTCKPKDSASRMSVQGERRGQACLDYAEPPPDIIENNAMKFTSNVREIELNFAVLRLKHTIKCQKT